MTDVYNSQPMSYDRDRAATEQAELAAFEKGRMQGEMEAIRRVEAEGGLQQKQMMPAQQPIVQLQRPDVVEINRLTWLQRLSFALGTAAWITSLALVIHWAREYNGGIGWDSSDNTGDRSMLNSGLFTGILGCICLGSAITHYRVFPLNTNANLNRAWYILLQIGAMICFSLTMVAIVQTSPESRFWAVDHWCYGLAFAVAMAHSLYSVFRTLAGCVRPHRDANDANGQHVQKRDMMESPEQRRDHSTYNAAGRSVYTPQPARLHGPHSASGAPNAPANAPRWAENPNTHAEDYFLMPRAKWATVGYFAIGAAVLMLIASQTHLRANGAGSWAQGQVNADGTPVSEADYANRQMGEESREAHILGALGLLTLFGLMAYSYVAMPPRTTLIKNGILQDSTRRPSVSHNAETRIGGQNIV